MRPLITPEIDLGFCDGCGRCVAACPAGALAVQDGRVALVHPDLCQWDAACELACPRNAIRVPYTVVFAERTRDNSS